MGVEACVERKLNRTPSKVERSSTGHGVCTEYCVCTGFTVGRGEVEVAKGKTGVSFPAFFSNFKRSNQIRATIGPCRDFCRYWVIR